MTHLYFLIQYIFRFLILLIAEKLLEKRLPPSLSFNFPASMAFRADSARVTAYFPP